MASAPASGGIDYSKFDGIGSSSEDEGHRDHGGQCPCCTQQRMLESAGLDASSLPPGLLNGVQNIFSKSEALLPPCLSGSRVEAIRR